MSVRAKFIVESITDFGSIKKVTLRAVSDDDIPENQRYHRYTPQGLIEISIDNPPASDQFKPGDRFYVDFTPVNK